MLRLVICEGNRGLGNVLSVACRSLLQRLIFCSDDDNGEVCFVAVDDYADCAAAFALAVGGLVRIDGPHTSYAEGNHIYFCVRITNEGRNFFHRLSGVPSRGGIIDIGHF